MKKAFLRFLSILMIGFMFFSCANSTGGDSDDSNTQKQQQQNNSGKTSSGKTNSGTTNNGTTDSGTTDSGTTDSGTTDSGTTDSGTTDSGTTDDGDEQKDDTPAVNRNIGVTFNFTGAQALAKLEAKQDGSRAVTNVDELGDLVKILADGSMENAITVDENCSLSDIVAIYKSPLEDSKDIFIVFNGNSVLGYEEVEKEYEWGGTYTDRQEIRVGQLICLHEDGSIADILKKDDATDYWNTHMSLRTESVTFDAAGNLYFISSDNGDMIYQYNPLSGELTKMVAAVEGTTYGKMQIDDEGQWIFVSGSRYTGSSSYFLRAIPINNPNGFVNIFYSSSNIIGTDKWTYDNKNGIMYFIVNDGNKEGLFTASKNTGFKTKEFMGNQTKTCRDIYEPKDLFKSFYVGYSDFKWNYLDENYNFSPDNLLDSIINNFRTISGYEKDSKKYTNFSLNRDYVDIRFDSFAGRTGKFELLYNLTKGKKNEELFEALNSWEGKAALYYLCYDEYYNSRDSQDRGYLHNLLADIVYVKDTDILLCDYDDVVFSYYDNYHNSYDENGNYVYDEYGNYVYEYENLHEVKGLDFFNKNKYGSYDSRSYFEFVQGTTGNHPSTLCYEFLQTPEEILNFLFSFCNVDGEKEFRLTAFKDDEQYGALYSTLTNEEALEWIGNDVERMSLFNLAMGDMVANNNRYISYIDMYGLYYAKEYCEYKDFIEFLSRTCYLKDSDSLALTWNMIEDFSIKYYYEYYNPGSLFVTPNGVYYEYTDNSSYYYLVQVADETSRIIEKIKKVDLPAGKVVRSERNNERLVLQYSIMDSNGAELGYHHIYAVDLESGFVTNCFDNVPNRNNLEVVSFNSAGDLLYYSAVRGTLVENGIVNLVTNEYNPLTVQRKMVAVYTFN